MLFSNKMVCPLFRNQLHDYENIQILCIHEIGILKFPHNVHQGYTSIKKLKVDLQIYIALITISGTVEGSFWNSEAHNQC